MAKKQSNKSKIEEARERLETEAAQESSAPETTTPEVAPVAEAATPTTSAAPTASVTPAKSATPSASATPAIPATPAPTTAAPTQETPAAVEATIEKVAEEVVLPVQERLALLEEAFEELHTMIGEVKDSVQAAPAKKGLFGGKRGRVPVKDTTTGVIYLSKSHCGQLLAGEADTDQGDHFAYYKLQSAFPDRFIEATEQEAATAKEYWDAHKAAEEVKAPEVAQPAE